MDTFPATPSVRNTIDVKVKAFFVGYESDHLGGKKDVSAHLKYLWIWLLTHVSLENEDFVIRTFL